MQNRPTSPTNVNTSLRRLRPAGELLTNKQDFGGPFVHRFCVFIQKLQNYEISEEYNAKRGSEPTKTLAFRIDVSLSFHVFCDPSLGEHFWRVKVPTYAKKMQFWSNFGSMGVQKHALELHFWPRGL